MPRLYSRFRQRMRIGKANMKTAVTINELAKLLGVSRQTVFNWRRDGYLSQPTYSDGALRFPVATVRQDLASNPHLRIPADAPLFQTT